MKTILAFFLFCATACAQISMAGHISATGAVRFTPELPQASTPTFSPAAGAVSNPTTVTASTSTSGCGSYIYFDTNPTPTTNQTTYSVTSGVTLYAYVHGCPGYADSSVGSAAYMIGSGKTHVQSCSNTIGASAASISCTFGSNITAGNFLWVCVANYASAYTSPVWSGDSGTFTIDMPSTVVAGGTFTFGSCYHVSSAGGGGNTITLTASNLQYTGLTIDEFSGVGALDVNDTPLAGPYSIPAVSSNSIAPTANGDLILGFSTISAGASPPSYTVGSGFTFGAGSTYTSQNEYMIQTTAAPVSATFTLSDSTRYWLAHVVAFK